MPRQFQFVAVSNPTGPVPSESRKLSHSHATRNAHARERRLRMERYQRETRLSTLKQNSTVVEIPSPLVQMPGHGKDPFAALARSLSSQEYFLLDHCTSRSRYISIPNPTCNATNPRCRTTRPLIIPQISESWFPTTSSIAGSSPTLATTKQKSCKNGSASPSQTGTS